MRKLILKMSITIDGFVGGPKGEIDWIFKSKDEGADAWLVDTLWQAGIHVMGSRTFHDMVAYWPTSSEPFAAPMNQIPKAVFTKRGMISKSDLTTRALKDAIRLQSSSSLKAESVSIPSGAAWSEARVCKGDIVEEVIRLKNEPGKDILAHGGAGFAQSLVASGLVDEYHFLVHPVALGKGLSLFASLPASLDLKLLYTTSFKGGAVANVYSPSKKRRIGYSGLKKN